MELSVSKFGWFGFTIITIFYTLHDTLLHSWLSKIPFSIGSFFDSVFSLVDSTYPFLVSACLVLVLTSKIKHIWVLAFLYVLLVLLFIFGFKAMGIGTT